MNYLSNTHMSVESSAPSHKIAHPLPDVERLADVIELDSARNKDIWNFHGTVHVIGSDKPVEWTASVPEQPRTDSWSLIVPGLGAFKRTSRLFRNAHAQNENVVAVSYGPSRGSKEDTRDSFWDPQALHVRTMTEIVEAVRNHSDLPGIPGHEQLEAARIKLIAHSMGGLAASRWAIEHPDDTEAVVLVGAAGLTEPKPLALAARTAQVVALDIVPGIVSGQFGLSPVMARRAWDHFGSNPRQTAAEIVSCLRADLRPELHKLMSLGIARSVISMDADGFFPPEDQAEAVAHLVDRFEIIAGTHTAPQRRARHVAAAISRVLGTERD